MLVLTVLLEETITIGEDISITILEARNGRVTIGFQAPVGKLILSSRRHGVISKDAPNGTRPLP